MFFSLMQEFYWVQTPTLPKIDLTPLSQQRATCNPRDPANLPLARAQLARLAGKMSGQ